MHGQVFVCVKEKLETIFNKQGWHGVTIAYSYVTVNQATKKGGSEDPP